MQPAGGAGTADESTDPPAGKERGPQDDKAVFKALAAAGQRLAEIHVHHEQQPEYKLTKVEKTGEKLDYCVTRMKLSKDKTSLIYNQFLTLSGIPKQTYDYRLDDPRYILRRMGQVITASLETVKIVQSLPPLGLGA